METTPVQQPVSQTQAEEAQRLAAEALPAAPSLKRKVAVGRFTNATRYGRALLYDDERDPLAEQASDIVSNRLAETDAFIVVERRDLELLEDEADLTGKQMDLIGVDTLLVGSVTEFGRKTEGKAGFLSSTKKQAAEAVVEVRMIDAKTGVVFATATGTGSASTEAGETMGFGTRAAFDATLTDKALSSAIADLMTAVMQNVTARPWQADILKVESERAFISGGRSQGLKVGDELAVMREGEAVRSERSGMVIRLPGEEVARVRVTGFFGDTELAEGAVVTLLSGRLPTSGEGHLVEEVRS
ncbi:CsgG/HfaB family protein [Parvularcula dongshanensis]|uniref:Curli biogenesis system outer membrane secretion channel CsgG n=1 Tax=Parvularcula dongshanensis TaxID=1173995 RepID=A0A840I518_9PROT|nr:curli biogenesis system outer membrane secretion channel CsgG [Parvularcula dongshanensis]